MKSVSKKVTVAAVAIFATLGLAGGATAAPASAISPQATCTKYIDKDTNAGSLHLKRCVNLNNEIRVYGWMQKHTDDPGCVNFHFNAFSDGYKRTWSVCDALEYTNVDTAYHKAPVTMGYGVPA